MTFKAKVKELFNKPEEAKKEQAEDKKENLSVQFGLDPTGERAGKIAELVDDLVSDYSNSRSGYMSQRAKYIRQYEGIKAPKTVPWPDSSNISTMVTTVACDLLHSKLYGMTWNEKSITWEGVEEHDVKVADMNKKVMSWVVSTDMGMHDTVDDMLQRLIIDGTIAIKKIWKPYWTYVTRKIPKEITPAAILSGKLEYTTQYDYIKRERCYIELRPLENVYFSYDANSSERNWEDKANIIDERWYTLAELKEMQLDGVISDKINLDNLKAKLLEEPEIKDTQKARMDAEGSEAIVTVPENYKIKCYEAEIMYDINDDGRREACVFFTVADMKMYLGGKPLHAISKVGRSSWVIRPFLRRPGRVYGKSIPELVWHLHEELDAIHNQRIDAGNMSIAPFFFYRAAAGTTPRRIIAGPATGIPLDDPERDVRFPSFPSQGLAVSFQEEKLVMELIERLTYLTPAMLGKETASRPTARGTLAVIQQGEQKFGLLGARVQNIYSILLTDIRQKYEEHMPPETWARILGRPSMKHFPSPESMTGMYEAKMVLDMTSLDPTADAQMAVNMFTTMGFDPFVMQNPAFAWEIRREYLEVGLKRKTVEKYIGPKPATEANTQDVDDMITLIEQEMQDIDPNNFDPSTVLPQLIEFQRSARYSSMSVEAKRIMEQVLRELKALYIQKINQGVQNAQAGGAQGIGADQGGSGGGSMGSFGPAGPRTMGSGGPSGGPNTGQAGV